MYFLQKFAGEKLSLDIRFEVVTFSLYSFHRSDVELSVYFCLCRFDKFLLRILSIFLASEQCLASSRAVSQRAANKNYFKMVC